MKKSIFTWFDIIELFVRYNLCFFTNFLFDYSKVKDLRSYLIEAFLKSFTDYQLWIIFMLSIPVIVFHYQLLRKTKTEIYCKVLVGETISNIAMMYMIDCTLALVTACILHIVLYIYYSINITNLLYLTITLMVYIIISVSKVRYYGGF